MPQGPGDDILDAIEGGAKDDQIMSKYKIDTDQLKAFKSLHYGLSNQKMSYDEISDYYPELTNYFKQGPLPAAQPNKPQVPVMEKPDFTKPVKQKQPVESTAGPAVLKSYQQEAESGKAGPSLQEKLDNQLKTAHQNINNELAGNDDVTEKLIREQRYDQAKRQDLNELAEKPRTDMPIVHALAETANRVIPPETKPQDLPVTQDDIAQTKSEIQSNEPQARQFLNQLILRKPDKAKEIQADAYLMDAMERIKQKPEIGLKVNDNLNKLKSGDLKYNAATGQLIKEEGFFPSIVSGIKERTKEVTDYDLFQAPDDQIIKLLEKRRAERDPDEPVNNPTGAGEIGQMTGMEWQSLLKGAATGLVSGAFGAEGAAPYLTAAINAPEYYKRSYATALEQSYNQLRAQNKTPEEALKTAQEQARYEGKAGAAEGALMSAVGSKIGLRDFPEYNITGGFKNAIKNVLSQTGHYAAETSIEGLANGLVSAKLQDMKNMHAEQEGIFRPTAEGLKDKVTGMLTFSLAMGAMTKAGKALIDPELRQKILYHMGRQPEETINTEIGNAVLDGHISPDDAKDIHQEVIDQKKVDETVPDDIKDVSRMAIMRKIDRRNELEKKLETTDKAFHPPIKEEIKKLNDEILEHSSHIKTNEDESKTETEAKANEADGVLKTETEPAPEKTGVVQSAPVSENITKDAADLLSSLSEGSKPTFITKNLERIANENGIKITDKMTADDVINALKEKAAKVPDNKSAPVSEKIEPSADYRTLNMGTEEGKEETKEARALTKERMMEGNTPMDGDGGKGETGRQFASRVLAPWEELKYNAEKNTTLVTHSSVLKAIKAWEDKGTWKDVEKPDDPANMNDEQWKAFASAFNKESTDNGDVETFTGEDGDIHVVRHGQTEDNAANKFRSGNTNLTERGIKQGEESGKILKEKTGGDIPKIISSDLSRAVHTSNIIHEQLKSTEDAAKEQGTTKGVVNESPTEAQKEVSEDPTVQKAAESFREKAGDLAKKIRGFKRGGKEAFGGFLGLTVAVYDGMLETAAKVLEAGGTIADALDRAVKFIKQHYPTREEDELRAAVLKEFSDNGMLMTDEQEKALEKIVSKTSNVLTNDKLHKLLKDSTGLPNEEISKVIENIRNPKEIPEATKPISSITPESRKVSVNKFNNLFSATKEEKPSWFRRQWESLKNASAYIDNPYRFITKITQDINKEYGLKNKEAIPLGRQFEKTAAGRAALKIDSFIDEVIRGKIGDRNLGRLKGEKYQDFQKYLAAKRVIDRLDKQEEATRAGEKVNRQTGNITRQDAQVMLQELETKYGDLNDFADRAKAFHGHMDTMLKELTAAGILSDEQYDNIKKENDFYAPFSVIQEKLFADQKTQPVGISGIVKRIKGIDYELPKTTGDALTMINSLGDALNKKIISPEEYFNTSLEILKGVRDAGIIGDSEYNKFISQLENPGFQLNDMLDAAANMIYKAEGIALKNRMLQRLYGYKAYDKEGMYIQDVEGHQPMTMPGGEVRMVPKQLNQIKVEPGMAAIKLRIDGKDKFVAVNEKAAEKLTAMNNYEVSTWMKAADVVNKIFRNIVITLSPGFQVANLAIDFVRTMMLSRYGPLAGKGLVQPIVNAVMFMPQYIEALMHSALGNVGIKTDAYKQWMKSDSFSKGMFDNLFTNEKRIKEVTAPLAKRLALDFLKLKFIEVPGSILEQTHKLATYQRGLSVEGLKPEMFTAMLGSIINRNLKENMSPHELKDAMDRLNYEVQNFAGSPNFPQTHRWMKLSSLVFQFFSARVKGEMTDYRRVANLFSGAGEGVKLSKQDRLQLMLQFTGAAGAITAYAILNNADDNDEKQFDGLPPYHQDNYLNIPAGTFTYTDDSGAKQELRDFFKIPLRGLTATMNVTANRFVKWYKRENPGEFKKMAEAFAGNASPINLNGSNERELGESLVSNLTPVYKFFIEYSFNRDTHNHRDLIPDYISGKGMLSKYEAGALDPWDVATKKTPPWAKTTSKWLYDNLGIRINAITLDQMENGMGNPTELYDNSLKKRLWRSEMKYPLYVPKK